MKTIISIDPPINQAPADLDPRADLPPGLYDFLLPLHREFTPRQQSLVAKQREVLARAHRGDLPTYLAPSGAQAGNWTIELPAWSQDQRNQMTGPGDDGELVVKMLNSGAPGVLLDFEDSVANSWENILRASRNILDALRGTLTYFDKKRDRQISIQESKTVITIRPRGLHLSQGGVIKGELASASLFDMALIAHQVDPARLRHPLTFYICKSESAAEALWWRDVFRAMARAKGWPSNAIKCMALIESHPVAYQMEEYLYNLQDHILALNLGRWDYMASLIDFTLHDPGWVLPDRNTIPHNVAFFQRLRELIPEICHKRGVLAIGGMTALYPSREDLELNARALKVLAEDKKNEANSLMDGAWTGHPDQNEIAVSQFPNPNQLHARRPDLDLHPDLRPKPEGVGRKSLEGTRAAVRTGIRYRNGVLNGKGASLLDGYMEDLATDRIYRYMIAQRVLHKVKVPQASGGDVTHTPELISRLFDEELERILREAGRDPGTPETFRRAREQSEGMVLGVLEAQRSPVR